MLATTRLYSEACYPVAMIEIIMRLKSTTRLPSILLFNFAGLRVFYAIFPRTTAASKRIDDSFVISTMRN
jgi:hypothetical protein